MSAVNESRKFLLNFYPTIWTFRRKVVTHSSNQITWHWGISMKNFIDFSHNFFGSFCVRLPKKFYCNLSCCRDSLILLLKKRFSRVADESRTAKGNHRSERTFLWFFPRFVERNLLWRHVLGRFVVPARHNVYDFVLSSRYNVCKLTCDCEISQKNSSSFSYAHIVLHNLSTRILSHPQHFPMV